MTSMDATTQTRWFHLTPGRFVLALLAVQLLLWLSDRLGWLGWHKGYAVLTGVAVVGLAMLVMLVWFAVAVIFSWRFQFSIRLLLVLVVVVALPCSWLAVEMKKAREQRAAVRAIEGAGGSVSYDWQGIYLGMLIPKQEPRSPRWLRTLLGDDFWEDVIFVEVRELRTDTLLSQLEELPQLQFLSLRNGKITGAGLENLKGLRQLRTLDLTANQLTDVGLDRIRELTQLERLVLQYNNITDAGLRHLTKLTKLERLILTGNDITDAGLKHLKGLTNLCYLILGDTKVTDKGVSQLKQALPNCKIGT